MVLVDYLMIAYNLERCDLWQSCDLINTNIFKRTVIVGKNQIDLHCKNLARFWDVPTSKRPELVNTEKAGGSDLDHPRAVNLNDKATLTVCLYACTSTCVRLRACVTACLPFCHPGRGGGGGGVRIFLFINLSECSYTLGLVNLTVCLFVALDIPCPGLPQTFLLICLKYDLFRKSILTMLNMLSVDHPFCERLYLCVLNAGSMLSREVVQPFNRTS